ncbi:hypothetical protein PFISCL1PPCAC_20869, partial [Pristionchus fissidentatus]
MDPVHSAMMAMSVCNSNDENLLPTVHPTVYFPKSAVKKPAIRKMTCTMKKDRKRNVFTEPQISALKTLYTRTPNVLRDEREQLGDRIGLTQEQIKIWLQNRRYKDKKCNPAS